MGRKQGVSIVVIVEDRALDRFVRKALTAFGLDRNKIRILPDYPKKGQGSGKQYVEKKYREEVVTFRKKGRESRALLLGSDADRQSVAERAEMLDAQVSAVGQPARGSDERIVYWIPKWHVETWGLHLTGTEVQEDRHYKKQARDVDWRTAGKAFVCEYHASKDKDIATLDSLKTAYAETRRLFT